MDEFERQNDSHWRFGIFYFNPGDPSVWVKKRVGEGWTLNFARPGSYLVMALMLAIPVFFVLFSDPK